MSLSSTWASILRKVNIYCSAKRIGIFKAEIIVKNVRKCEGPAHAFLFHQEKSRVRAFS